MFESITTGPLFDGALVTLQLTVLGGLLGTALAVASGLATFSSWAALRGAVRAYVELFRGTSAIVQLFWAFFGLPLLAPVLPEFIPERLVRWTPVETGIIVLGLNMGAYGSEVVRSGIQAIGQGQREAAVALSLTPYQRMRYVIFPQAVLVMLPPYGNLLIELLKGTALVSTATASELVFEASKLRVTGTGPLPLYSSLLFIYFGIAVVITALVRSLEWYFSRGLDQGRGA